MLCCWNCGHDLSDEPLPLSRHATCDQCAEFLHCCRFCIHFDQNRPDDCANDHAEPPNDKTTANFCEFFQHNPAGFSGKSEPNQDAQAKLNALFGDTDTHDSGDKNPLDDLFDD